jgi:MFS family permease
MVGRSVKGTAYLIWPALVAPVVAPPLGGLITTYASWHWRRSYFGARTRWK